MSTSTADACYMPDDYDNLWEGPINLRAALAESRNIPAIKTLYLAGIKDSIATAKAMGITSLNDPDKYGLTLVLGGGEVSLIDEVSAYGVFANNGVRLAYTGILSIFSTRIRRGMVLPIFEDGMESRDFVEVKDVVRAITLCMPPDNAAGQVFNVGSGVPTTVLNVASMLNQIFKGTSETEVTGQYRVGDIRHCYADISALRAATGFEPRVSLEQGLAAFATWVGGQPLPDDGLDQANRALLEKGLMK